jgi:hypothetical protein
MSRLEPLLSAMVSVMLASCGGGGRGTSGEANQPVQPVSVNIIEPSVTVEVTRTFKFHFNVSNTTYPTCTWTVNDVVGGDSKLGTITSEGLFTAPASVPIPNIVTVKATATADTTKSDVATITVRSRPTDSPAGGTVSLDAPSQFSGNTVATKSKTADSRNPSR